MFDSDRLTCIGVVTQAHGLKGEIRIMPLTPDPGFYGETRRVYLEMPAGMRAFPVERSRFGAAGWFVTLAGVSNREAAEGLKGARLLVEESELKPLQEGEFFQHDLIGCRVETLAGAAVGQVAEVMETGANEVLVVEGGRGAVMIPLVAEVIKKVDIVGRLIRIEPLPGLLEPDDQNETH